MTETASKTSEMIHAIVGAICRKTPNPKIVESEGEFIIQVSGEDHGKLVGRLGASIWAFSTLALYAGVREFRAASRVQLEEPEHRGDPSLRVPFRAIPNWDKAPIQRMISTVLQACTGSAVWVLEDNGSGRVTVRAQIPAAMRHNLQDPDFEEAFRTLLKTAGMSNGVMLSLEVEYK